MEDPRDPDPSRVYERDGAASGAHDDCVSDTRPRIDVFRVGREMKASNDVA